MGKPIILASGSPRRHELLRQLGLDFEVCECGVDETEQGQSDEVVIRLAVKKAAAAFLCHPDRIILAADTLVCADGHTLGKPLDVSDAFRMLKLLQGKWHEVYTGLCLIKGEVSSVRTAVCMTRVQFIPLEDAQIQAYINSGEPFGKAGAYAIQGLAGMFVSGIEGSYSNVVGLPLHLVKSMLEKESIQLL